MGGEERPPDPDPAGPSTFKGTFQMMMDILSHLLATKSAAGHPGHKAFGDLSRRLQPGSKPEERASALAVIVERCLCALNSPQYDGLPELKALLPSILGVLRRVCMNDHTGYGPVHSSCLQFYGECLAALDIFAAKAAWLFSMRMSKGVEAEDDHLLAKQIQREMRQATVCMARCWSVIRSEGGHPISSTTFEGELHELAADLDGANTLLSVESKVISFCGQGLMYIAYLSFDILEGMATRAKLLVDEDAAIDKFEECEKLLESFKGGDQEKGLKSLQEVFASVEGRHGSAMKVAALQKLPDRDPAKQIPSKNKVDEKLKIGLSSGMWSSKLKSLAAELLPAGHKELFFAMWQSDIDSCGIAEDHFADQASRLLFSAAPFTFAVRILLKYREDGLRPGAAGTAEVEEGTFVNTMNIRLKTVRQKVSPEKCLDEVLTVSAEDGKKTEGMGTPRMTAGSQSSPITRQYKKHSSRVTPKKAGRSQSTSPGGHGEKDEITQESTSGSASSFLGPKIELHTTAEGTVRPSVSKAVGGPEEAVDRENVGTAEDAGSPKKVGTPEEACDTKNVGILEEAGKPDNVGTSEDVGTPEDVANPDKVCTPGEARDPENVGTPADVANPENVRTPEEAVDRENVGTPEDVANPKNVPTPEEAVGRENVGTPEHVANPENVRTPEEAVDREHVRTPEEGVDRENVRVAQRTEGLSSAAITSVTARASLGHPTQADLEQVRDGFVINCSLAEVQVLLQSYAQGFHECMGNGNEGTVSTALLELKIPELQDIGLHLSTGHWHPGIERLNMDLPRVVETLAQAGLRLEGPDTSLVEGMRKHFDTARALASDVTGRVEEAIITQLKDLGFATLMFTLAACRLLKVLRQNTP